MNALKFIPKDPIQLFTLVTNRVTDSLSHSCLVNLIDVTLACEDANLKLVEVITVADVDACWQQFVIDLGADVWS